MTLLIEPYVRDFLPHRVFLIRDEETTLYRAWVPLDSRFAWVRFPAAAARFKTRKDAARVARAYERGEDLAGDVAMKSPHPEKIIYADKALQAMWGAKMDRTMRRKADNEELANTGFHVPKVRA